MEQDSRNLEPSSIFNSKGKTGIFRIATASKTISFEIKIVDNGESHFRNV